MQKVTNQLVNICKEYLLEMTVSVDNDEYFWPNIFKDIEYLNNSNSLNDLSPEVSNLNTSVSFSFFSFFEF